MENQHPGRSPLTQFWSGRSAGLPGALWDLCIAGWRAGADRLSTLLRVRNLGSVGPAVVIQCGVVIRHPGRIHLSSGVRIGRHAVLTTERAEGSLRIGPDTWIDRDCHIDFSGELEIGTACTLSAGVRLYTHDHGRNPRSEPNPRKLRIGNGVWIGTGAAILQNVGEIGDGSLVAANAVVTKIVPPGVLVAGNPARVIGSAVEQGGDPSEVVLA